MRSGRFAARRHRKFSTSMSSVVWRSTCGYKIHRPSGETVNPTDAGLSVVKIGMALLVEVVERDFTGLASQNLTQPEDESAEVFHEHELCGKLIELSV